VEYLLNGLKRSRTIRGFDVIEPASPASMGRVVVGVDARIADAQLTSRGNPGTAGRRNSRALGNIGVDPAQ
jgi:hypothetical protein